MSMSLRPGTKPPRMAEPCRYVPTSWGRSSSCSAAVTARTYRRQAWSRTPMSREASDSTLPRLLRRGRNLRPREWLTAEASRARLAHDGSGFAQYRARFAKDGAGFAKDRAGWLSDRTRRLLDDGARRLEDWAGGL